MDEKKKVGRFPAAQSQESLEKMKDIERFISKVYDDAKTQRDKGFYLSEDDIKNKRYKGNPTIGYGHLLSKEELKSGKVGGSDIYSGISKELADKLVRNHKVRKDVNRQIQKVSTPMSQDMEDALHEAGYNIGAGSLRKIINTINKSGWDKAAERLRKYNTATVKDEKTGKKKKVIMRGLTDRREDEASRMESWKTPEGAEEVERRHKLDLLKDLNKKREVEELRRLMEDESDIEDFNNAFMPKLMKDGGIVKKYKDGGISRSILEPEVTAAPYQSNPIHELMRKYKAENRELPEQVPFSRYITPEEENKLKDLIMPDVSRKATFDLPQKIKTDEDILDDIVREMELKQKFADGGIPGSWSAKNPVDHAVRNLNFEKSKLQEALMSGDMKEAERAKRAISAFEKQYTDNAKIEKISNEQLRDIFDGDINKYEEAKEIVRKSKSPTGRPLDHTFSNYNDQFYTKAERKNMPDDLRSWKYGESPEQYADREMGFANTQEGHKKIRNKHKNAKFEADTLSRKADAYEASKFKPTADRTTDEIEDLLRQANGKAPRGKLSKGLSKVGKFIKPIAKGASKLLPGVGLAVTGAGLYSSMAEGADATEAVQRELEGEPLVMAGKAMSDIAPAKGASMRAGKDKVMRLLEELRAKEQITPQLTPEEEEAAKKFAPKASLTPEQREMLRSKGYAKGGVVHAEDGEVFNKYENPFLRDLTQGENLFQEGDEGYEDYGKQETPSDDSEPTPAKEDKDVKKVEEVDRKPTSEPKSEKKSELDVQSKYEQLLAELEKPAKREEYGRPSWGSTLADSLAALSNIYNYAQGDKPMFEPSAMASERARFDKQQATKTASSKDNIKSRADILKQLQDLKGGGMTAYQKASLDLRKKEHEAKQKSKSDLTWEQKEAKKADIKSSVQEKKENREIRNDAKSALDALEQQEKTINEALEMLEKDGVATGPLDQYYSKFTAEGQTLEKKLNNLALDKMVKMFAGMSKAIDSDAERAFFQSTVPSMGDYERVNIETLRDLRDTIQKLKAKTNKAISSYDKSGTFKEQDSIEHVTMVAPDGQVKTVRKDKVQKYLDKGAKVLEE